MGRSEERSQSEGELREILNFECGVLLLFSIVLLAVVAFVGLCFKLSVWKPAYKLCICVKRLDFHFCNVNGANSWSIYIWTRKMSEENILENSALCEQKIKRGF